MIWSGMCGNGAWRSRGFNWMCVFVRLGSWKKPSPINRSQVRKALRGPWGVSPPFGAWGVEVFSAGKELILTGEWEQHICSSHSRTVHKIYMQLCCENYFFIFTHHFCFLSRDIGIWNCFSPYSDNITLDSMTFIIQTKTVETFFKILSVL